jgi:hypothetical protein
MAWQNGACRPAGATRCGWAYNQETSEQPQLYFSHDFKVGNAYQLAPDVRRGLETLNVVLQ